LKYKPTDTFLQDLTVLSKHGLLKISAERLGRLEKQLQWIDLRDDA
jgi:hypothetical protein